MSVDQQAGLSCAVIIFSRAPEPGEVKTRLLPALTPQHCAALHEMLTRHCVQQAQAFAPAELQLCVSEAPFHPFFHTLCELMPELELSLQSGDDLGQRMFRALGSALQRQPAAAIVGSDCPFIDPAYYRRALQALAEGADYVLGPALDGGYVLLACRQVHAAVFADIPWGSGEVLQRTRARLSSLGLHWQELEALADIDRPEDLGALKALPDPHIQGFLHALDIL